MKWFNYDIRQPRHQIGRHGWFGNSKFNWTTQRRASEQAAPDCLHGARRLWRHVGLNSTETVRTMQQGSMQAPEGVREGDVLAGKYRIEKVLGIGGMGVVVAAHHVQLDEKVAIKFLLPAALSNQEAVARFAREARAAVKIKSEHVARVSDVGTLDNGAPYMVMEHLDGGDLAAWVQQRGPLPVEQAAEFMLQACEAVADAHGLGIVHRDLKPSNLFCVRRSDGLLSIKVLDFGISKVTNFSTSGSDMGMTKTTMVMGSPLYMSPEQMRSARDVDARTDIWAVGIILYELLTGKTPFAGESLAEICVRATVQPPAPLRDRRPEVPLGLEAVILKCLEKKPENRYANVAELALALAPYAPKRARSSVERITRVIQASGLSATALALPPSSQAVPESAPQGTQGAWGQTKSGRKWGTAGAAVAVALFGAGVLGAVMWLSKGQSTPDVAPPASSNLPRIAATSPVGTGATVAPAEVPAEGSTAIQPAFAIDAGSSPFALGSPEPSSDDKNKQTNASGVNPTNTVVHPTHPPNTTHGQAQLQPHVYP